jgi:hypothetical protein
MDHETEAARKITIRANMANKIENAANELSEMLSMWIEFDLPGDFLAEREYPFQFDLEEQIASMHAAAALIRDNNEWLRMKPLPPMVVSKAEYERLLDMIDKPAKPLPRLVEMLRQQSPWED